MNKKRFVIKNCGDRWGKTNDEIDKLVNKKLPLKIDENYKFWEEPNDCPYCNLPNSELDYDLVEENDGSKHDVVDCPRCKNRLFYEE